MNSEKNPPSLQTALPFWMIIINIMMHLMMMMMYPEIKS